ncbi:hypothetical protein AUK45_02985 [Candidatus Peregrinibacteria bacterium CG2_30_44_17]|nr:MAG: hypothetical protein AUK45_02985 [Candidatus Peregrinibacteria bacterium CG2_30_44_17]
MSMYTKAKKGFTLVELILYLAILAILLPITAFLLLNLQEGAVKARAIRTVSQNGRFAFAQMQLAVRNADTITSPSVGATSSSLVLVTDDPATNPTSFFVSGTRLMIQEGSSASAVLTELGVQITDLQFQNVSPTGTSGTLRMQFSVSPTSASGNPAYTAGQQFWGTSAIRKRL